MCGCMVTKAGGPSHASLAKVSPLGVRRLERPGWDPSVHIVDLDLHEEPSRWTNIPLYYRICGESSSACLRVTTSCFAVWKRNRNTNGHAKVIPAVRAGKGSEPTCVFFFDDNLQCDGTEGGKGICNLRDACTGDFVDFSAGSNGFSYEHCHRHTIVIHSSQYRNVLVKANILDAINYEDYFWGIIHQYARPGERLLVFMDVNSTIMCNDSSAGKDVCENLLSIMFELIEVRPRESFEVSWGTFSPVTVDRKMSMKQLVKEVHHFEKEATMRFWQEENCQTILRTLSSMTELAWLTGTKEPSPVNPNAFVDDFREYLGNVTKEFSETGITRSWFRCYDTLKKQQHSVILNSFGTDTRKVVRATVPDEREVPQITVNFELWEDGDKSKFMAQYCQVPAPPKTAAAPAAPDVPVPGVAEKAAAAPKAPPPSAAPPSAPPLVPEAGAPGGTVVEVLT